MCAASQWKMNAFRSFVALSGVCTVLGVVLVLDRVTVQQTLTTGQHRNMASEILTDSVTNLSGERETDEAQANTTLPYVHTHSGPNTTRTFAQDMNSSNAFLGFLEINEQLSSNTLKFLELSYFSALWNLTMIEPWIDIDSAHLYSLPPVSKPQTLLLFDLYNKTALEKQLTKCFKPNLPKQSQKGFVFHTLNEALIHSPRDVLIVTFKSTKWTDTMGNGECDSISSEEKRNVLSILNHHVQRVKDEAQKIHGQDFTFKIWRTVCITAVIGVPFSMKNATIFIQQQLVDKQRGTSKSAIVVLPKWERVMSANPYRYYYDPNFHLDKRYCQERALPHSSKVMAAAEGMMETYGVLEHFISVYARTERLSHMKPEAVKQCLDEFPKVLENIEKYYIIPHTRIVLIHDAGNYGSSTFDNNSRSKSQKVLSFLQSFNMTTAHYDPKLIQNKDLPQHRSFAAAVEQEFLSRSHVLLTLGDGGFMINVKRRFISRQSADRAYSLCG